MGQPIWRRPAAEPCGAGFQSCAQTQFFKLTPEPPEVRIDSPDGILERHPVPDPCQVVAGEFFWKAGLGARGTPR